MRFLLANQVVKENGSDWRECVEMEHTLSLLFKANCYKDFKVYGKVCKARLKTVYWQNLL